MTMQYDPHLLREVYQMLTSHGLVVISVDTEKGEFHVAIPDPR